MPATHAMTLQFILAFVFSAMTTAVLTPLVARLARSIGAVDVPDARKMHEGIVPRMGGVAIAMGMLAGAISVASLPGVGAAGYLRLGAVTGGGVLILILGTWDDVRGTRPATKFAVQFAAALIVWAGGVRITDVNLPLIGPVHLGTFGLPITLLWVTGVTNAINLLDGLDGLAAGLSAIIAASLLFMVWGHDVLATVVALTIIGSCIAFLWFNLRPRRVFMGDSGSLLLGFLLACVAIICGQKRTAAVALAVPFIALGVPVIDTLVSMARRAISGRSPFSADAGHIHHLLLSLGLNRRRTVLLLYATNLVLGLVAMLLVYLQGSLANYALLALLVVAAWVYRRFGYISLRLLLRGRRWNRLMERIGRRIEQAHDLPDVLSLTCRAARILEFDYLAIYPNGNGRVEDLRSVLNRTALFGKITDHIHSVRGSGPLDLPVSGPNPALPTGGANDEARIAVPVPGGPARLNVVLGDSRARRASELQARRLLLAPVLQHFGRYVESHEEAFQWIGR